MLLSLLESQCNDNDIVEAKLKHVFLRAKRVLAFGKKYGEKMFKIEREKLE